MMKTKGIAIVAAALLGAGSCHLLMAQEAGTPPSQTAPAESPPAQSAPVTGGVIYLGAEAPYADAGRVDRAVLSECQLPQQQTEYILSAAREAGISVVRDPQAVNAGKGRILKLEIVDVTNWGNAFTGHRKQVALKGRLFEDGKEIGDFYGKRSSMGGIFAGFKGSCSVLGRCIEALARDMTPWLKSPSANARIGE
jgi:hypothetical protein